MSKIKLSNNVFIDLPKLVDSRLLVQANSGGGKSWAIRRIVEQAFGKVQIIMLDPEGEFTNLRTKFDFVYAGKGGDAPVESRSAALLAHRLLELKASAIVDLYEMPPQERKHFVKLFLEAMVNAPKELWHDVLVIIDEAHVFAPEKGESEAMGAVIDLATRGRKRGYCVVLATQRLPKLNKDAAAECNNKLIGRASQDIDRKRAAEELGFSGKEQILSLRDLEPGEFYAFGPAISREVVKTTIGDVAVKPPPRSQSKMAPPPPSAAVKKLLGSLKDLPQEAQKELKTTTELKNALTLAKRRILELEKVPAKQDPDAIKKLTDKAFDLGVEAGKHNIKMAQTEINRLSGLLGKIWNIVKNEETAMVVTGEQKFIKVKPEMFKEMKYEINIPTFQPREELSKHFPGIKEESSFIDPDGISQLGKGELTVLTAIAQNVNVGLPRESITTITGYKRSTRDAYLKRLQDKGFVMISDRNNRFYSTQEGADYLGPDFTPIPSSGLGLRNHIMQTLPKGERDILTVLFDNAAAWVPREFISNETGFKRSTRDAYIKRLQDRQLVESNSQGVRAVERLIEGL